jgi:hypothetical protein
MEQEKDSTLGDRLTKTWEDAWQQRMNKLKEDQSAQDALLVDKLRQDYLKRTGRERMKP